MFPDTFVAGAAHPERYSSMTNMKSFIQVTLISTLLYGCTGKYEFPSEVITSEKSKNGELVASVLKGENESTVFFSISSSSDTRAIIITPISIPTGYHEPLIKVEWKSKEKVTFIIDHDFGEGNHVYEYDIQNYVLKRL